MTPPANILLASTLRSLNGISVALYNFIMDQAKTRRFFLNDEPGADVIENLLFKAQRGKIRIIVSLSCLGEVYYITKQRKGIVEAKKVAATIKEFPVELVGLSEGEILSASDFKADYSISLADSYVAGIASRYKAIVVTKDPEFKEIEKDKKLEFLWI